jgi:SAM-dependent methyltransferase
MTDTELDEPGLPERAVDPDWLALREPADIRSRDGAADLLLPPLLEALARRRAAATGPGDGLLRVVDLGAGTGANGRWLAPRLGDPAAQRWLLVDHDPRLVAVGPVPSRTVRADVADLPRLLADPDLLDGGVADLVTACALLDLLDVPQLEAVADAVVAAGVPALFSLSVTGEVRLDPADDGDAAIADAFDTHQRRDGRPGPDGGAVAAALFRDRGWRVVEAATPWLLDSAAEPELVEVYLDGRAEAAAEQRPDRAAEVAAWRERRRAASAAGPLIAVVGHLDVLAVPPSG